MKRTLNVTIVVESKEQNESLLRHAVCSSLCGSEFSNLGEWPDEFVVSNDHCVDFQIKTVKIGEECIYMDWDENGKVNIPNSENNF